MNSRRSHDTRSIQKLIIFSHTGNKQLENKSKKNSIHDLKYGILRDKFNKRCVRLVHWKLENIAEINWRSLNTWRDIPFWWVGRLTIIKMSVISKLFLSVFRRKHKRIAWQHWEHLGETVQMLILLNLDTHIPFYCSG